MKKKGNDENLMKIVEGLMMELENRIQKNRKDDYEGREDEDVSPTAVAKEVTRMCPYVWHPG